MVEFVIFATSYDESSGGSLVLHHLCHLINKIGYKASLVTFSKNRLTSFPQNKDGLWNQLSDVWSLVTASFRSRFELNPNLMTPIFRHARSISARADLVVVYPEIVAGNPLNARNVARWLLHEPGFHTGEIFFNRGDVQFLYSRRFSAVQAAGLEIAPDLLDIIVVPWDLYIENNNIAREGTAYAMRKRSKKPIVHETSNSIPIDDLTPAEVASVLKRVRTFISYDPHTMYSAFAVLAGCDSVVIPDHGVSIDQWCPDIAGRAGIAYGFDDLLRARATRDELISRLRDRDRRNVQSVQAFVQFWSERIDGKRE